MNKNCLEAPFSTAILCVIGTTKYVAMVVPNSYTEPSNDDKVVCIGTDSYMLAMRGHIAEWKLLDEVSFDVEKEDLC